MIYPFRFKIGDKVVAVEGSAHAGRSGHITALELTATRKVAVVNYDKDKKFRELEANLLLTK